MRIFFVSSSYQFKTRPKDRERERNRERKRERKERIQSSKPAEFSRATNSGISGLTQSGRRVERDEEASTPVLEGIAFLTRIFRSARVISFSLGCCDQTFTSSLYMILLEHRVSSRSHFTERHETRTRISSQISLKNSSYDILVIIADFSNIRIIHEPYYSSQRLSNYSLSNWWQNL